MDNKIDILALILASAYYHPNTSLRKELQDKLEKEFKAGEDHKKLKKLLLDERGTDIEPFRLTEADTLCTSMLCTIAFSELGKQTRVRIVSRDTIGNDGGLVITSNLKSFYLKRYNKNNDGKPYGQPKNSWSFVPSLIPTKNKEFKTFLIPDKDGFKITLKLPETSRGSVFCQMSYIKSGYIEGNDASLDKLGLKLEVKENELTIRSGSPESVIKLIAHMTKGAELFLKGDDPEIPDIKIKLAPPEEEKIELKTIVSSTPYYCNWLMGNCTQALTNKINLNESEIHCISEWLLPHKDWINSLE